MTDNNDLFPFPENSTRENSAAASHDAELPAFPAECSEPAQPELNDADVRDLKTILEIYRQGHLGSLATVMASPDTSAQTVIEKTPLPPSPSTAASDEKALIHQLAAALEAVQVSDPAETEAKAIFKAIVEESADFCTGLRILTALSGLFPAKKCLRHGTPEQRLFALTALGDRFLEELAGLAFNGRKKLLKAAARYLSQVSDGFGFIQMEGEAFSSQYHERVAGASAAGKTVREMHGFLVVGRDGAQVVRIGMVLT